jgi:hypothetical protein
MLSPKLKILLLTLVVLFSLFISCKCNDGVDDYDDDAAEFEDCQYEIDFKTFKKTRNVSLCNSLSNPSLKSRIQLQIYTNHTEEKIRIRALSLSTTTSNLNKSLIGLTTDIIEDFKYPTSLLTIDDFQLIGLAPLQSILLSLINIDLNLLSKNIKKTLIVAKGGHKQLLSCSGNLYPKQDIKTLKITPDLIKPIACTKEPQPDRFFTLQEKIYLPQANKNTFRLVDIHQNDPKKVTRTSWYTCNNPASCTNGVQKKPMLDKTVNYVLKYLQKGRTETKTASG